MLRRHFLKRMAFAALASGLLGQELLKRSLEFTRSGSDVLFSATVGEPLAVKWIVIYDEVGRVIYTSAIPDADRVARAETIAGYERTGDITFTRRHDAERSG